MNNLLIPIVLEKHFTNCYQQRHKEDARAVEGVHHTPSFCAWIIACLQFISLFAGEDYLGRIHRINNRLYLSSCPTQTCDIQQIV